MGNAIKIILLSLFFALLLAGCTKPEVATNRCILDEDCPQSGCVCPGCPDCECDPFCGEGRCASECTFER